MPLQLDTTEFVANLQPELGTTYRLRGVVRHTGGKQPFTPRCWPVHHVAKLSLPADKSVSCCSLSAADIQACARWQACHQDITRLWHLATGK